MSMLQDFSLDPQLLEIETISTQHQMIVGILKDSTPNNPLLFSLEAIQNLTDRKLIVFMERNFGKISNINDLEYTERGAEVMEAPTIIREANIILKYTPFIEKQIFQLKNNQIVISTMNPEKFTHEMAIYLMTKKITALNLSYITDKKGDYILEKILTTILSKNAQTLAIGTMLTSILASFYYHGKVRNVLQFNPELLNSVYCYLGDICHPKVAQNAKVPWKNIVDLCWDWN